MPTSRIEISSAVMTHKRGHTVSGSTMSTPKPPFVICSVSTKRYTPSMTQRGQGLRLPPISTKEQLTIPRRVPVKQTLRPGSLSTTVPKAEPHRLTTGSMSVSAPSMTAKVQKSPPLPGVSSAVQRAREKTFVPKSSKVVSTRKEGELIGRRSAQVSSICKLMRVASTAVEQLPPRPSCVPRCRIGLSVGVSKAPKGRQDVKVKVSTTVPRKPAVAYQQPFVKKPIVPDTRRTAAPTRDQTQGQSTYPYAVHADWSPPPSPDLSSFPSQTWTIVVDVNVKQVRTPTTICGDEISPSMDDAPKPDVVGIPGDLYAHSDSESVSSSPTLSSPTVVETLSNRGESMVGPDDMTKISTPTREPSVEVSNTICAATIISPASNGTSSMASLAQVMKSSFAPSPIRVRDGTTIQRAIGVARAVLSPSRRAFQAGSETTSCRAMGINVSRIRKLFIPPLDKDAKASRNPTTQMEIEMLRARKKVANGGVVNPNLDRLGSLSAIAIVERLQTSSSYGPGRVLKCRDVRVGRGR